MRKTWTYKRKNIPGWWVGWYEGGKRKSKAFPNKALAEHFAQIKYQQVNSDVFTSVVSVTWDTLMEEYEQSKRVRGLTDEGIYQAMLTLKKHFRHACGPLNSKQITQASLDKFILKRGKQVGRFTLNKDISNMKAFLNWGKRNKYISEDVSVHKVKVDNKDVKPLNRKQVKNLLLTSQQYPTWYTRILLSLTTGLRKNDIESLSVADIDFEINAIDTRSKKTRKSMLFRPLPPKVTDHLAVCVGSLPAGQVRLFTDNHTHKKWKKIRTRAGLPHLRYQDLRVTFSSLLAEAGASTSVRQRLLEHSSPQITEDYYTKVQDPVLRNAVDMLPVDEWL
ncbi:MAG: tyrosine-type recombinase/integrase [Candidatus Aenigmarchaeota archaeon]|nr:tyrosine-type recombinase/integrase [Candidatus Aenigmarchaeota archaeon]